MFALFMMLPLLVMMILIQIGCAFYQTVLYRIKIGHLIENIQYKEDLLFMRYKDFLSVIQEVLRRKGYHVQVTNRCGEDDNGFILDKIQYAELWKHGLHHIVDVEAAMKLARRMQINSIHRGMLITLGDFRTNTKLYCHTHVIQCINGDQLLALCKEVQRKSLAFGNIAEKKTP